MVPTVSVIIPTYNRKTIVVDAIRSVLDQDYKDFEIIVVDDGSTDGTVEYLSSCNFPVRIISKKNGGAASARNAGISASKGGLVAFLDSDDVWLPEKMGLQVRYLQAHPVVALVYTDEYIEESGERKNKTRFQLNAPKDRMLGSAFTDLIPIHTSSVMMRRSVLDDIGMFNEELKIHEDSELWNRVSEKHTFGWIDRPLVVYRWAVDSGHLMNPDNKKMHDVEGEKYRRIFEERNNSSGHL